MSTENNVLNRVTDVLDEHASDERSFWGKEDRHGFAAEAERLLAEFKDYLVAAENAKVTDGVALIAQERSRHINQEGWSTEHDDIEHTNGELAQAAICYVKLALLIARNEIDFKEACDRSAGPFQWPWSLAWWKPSQDPIINLSKAGGLIGAEIERYQRRAAIRRSRAVQKDPT